MPPVNQPAVKVHYFKNATRSGVIGSKKPADMLYLHGHPFYMGPGDVIHDPQGIMWPLLRETGDRYSVVFEDGQELLDLAQKHEIQSAAMREGRILKGLRYVLEPLTDEQVALHVAAAATSPQQIIYLKQRAAAADVLATENQQVKEKNASLERELNELKAQAEPANASKLADENALLKDQIKKMQEEFDAAKEKASRRRG